MGKTCIVLSSIGKFKKNPESTIGVDYITRHIDNPLYDIQFWDTAGQERFQALNPMYIRDSDIQMVVYDISNVQSFGNISYWVEEIRKYRLEPRMILVGNKMDQKRTIEQEQGFNLAKMYGMYFIEVSAIKKLHINELMSHIVELIKKWESIQNNEFVTHVHLMNTRSTINGIKKIILFCC